VLVRVKVVVAVKAEPVVEAHVGHVRLSQCRWISTV
jgi:hypothetical protein